MLLSKYKNGNASVVLFSDGTRIIETQDNDFHFDFPCSMDVTITKSCDGGCPWCYLGCTTNGKHADLLGWEFFNTLHPGTEIAINLNDMTHPQLLPFLRDMRDKYHVFVNGTVNQTHFMKTHNILKRLCDAKLLWGVGVSLQKPTAEFVRIIKEFDNAVIHTINGILDADDIEMLRDNDLKILILGYKDIGRGDNYYKENEIVIKMRQRYLYDILDTLPDHFKVVSFDNNAINQLDVKRILSDLQWEEFYQGDEGTLSMYVDLVDGKFGLNSMASGNDLYPIMDSIDDMFEIIKNRKEDVA